MNRFLLFICACSASGKMLKPNNTIGSDQYEFYFYSDSLAVSVAKESLTCVLGFLCIVSQSCTISPLMDFRQNVLVVVRFFFIYLLNFRAIAASNLKNEKTSQILEASG